MGVIGSLSRGIGTLTRNPVIPALVFAYSLLSTGLAALNLVEPLLVFVGYGLLLFIVPFYLGGIIGAVDDALDGSASVGGFFSAGTSNYLSLLLGVVAIGILTFVLYFVVAIVGVVLAVFVLGMGSMAGVTSASVAVLAVAALFGLIVVLLPWFVLQFFPAAVVVDDLGLIDSIKRSGALVKNNFLSVVGFDIVSVLISLVAQVSTVYLFFVSETPSTAPGTTAQPTDPMAGQTLFDTLSTTELGIYFGSILVLGTIVSAISHAFYVAYYDQLPR